MSAPSYGIGSGVNCVTLISLCVHPLRHHFHFYSGLPISEALQLLHDKLTLCEPKLSPFKACSVCDYFCNTFIRHYHLYQFVLCQERDLRQHLAHLEVCGPPQPLPLMAGTEVEAAKHQQQLAALSAAEAQKRTDMLLLQERLHWEKERMLQRVYDRVNAQAETLDRKVSVWARPTQFRKETLEGGMRRVCKMLNAEEKVHRDLLFTRHVYTRH